MRSVFLFVAGAVLSQAASAQEPAPSPAVPFLAAVKQPDPGNGPAPVYTEPTAVYVGGTNPVLNPQEAAGVGITRAWEDRSYQAMVQTPGTDGAIQFHYGQSLPVIVCGMLQVTDVELQPGELVNEKPYLGDSERWVVESAVSGMPPTQTQHLIIKPRDVGLQTSLVVPTDRRTYHFLLLSHATEFMHHVTFVYGDKPPSVTPASVPPSAAPQPETAAGGAGVKVAYEAPSVAPRPSRQAEGKGTPSKARDGEDEYEISGHAPWKPLSAYHTA
ncbi:MAG TPA: TrbG/VirB9 family P-type conjugative transfer protein, partial [Chthoniobacterales bacterium]